MAKQIFKSGRRLVWLESPASEAGSRGFKSRRPDQICGDDGIGSLVRLRPSCPSMGVPVRVRVPVPNMKKRKKTYIWIVECDSAELIRTLDPDEAAAVYQECVDKGHTEVPCLGTRIRKEKYP